MVDRIILTPAPAARTISVNIQGPRGPRGFKGEGAVESLSEIPDINTSSLLDENILVYDTTTSKWVSTPPENLVVTLSDTQTVTGNKTFSGSITIGSNLNLSNQKITNLAEPVSGTDAATKDYVDANAQGLIIKDEVKVASTGNVTLYDTPDTIDTYTLIEGDRILLKDQDDPTKNGIYEFVVDSNGNSLQRTTDADEDSEVSSGMYVFVVDGDVNRNTGYVLTTTGAITLEVTPLTFTRFSSAGNITAGGGLTMTGQTINVITADSGRIVVNANDIDLATAGTAGTYTLINTDAYGRVSSGSQPTSFASLGITDAVVNTTTITAGTGLTGGGDLSTSRTLQLTGQALSFHNLSSTGIVTRTAADTIAARTITGTTDKITITDGNGVSGNPTITIASTYAGQNTITTLGTITSGTWNGTTVGVTYGGTGADLSGVSSGTLIKKGASTLEAATAGTDYYNTSSTINGGTF